MLINLDLYLRNIITYCSSILPISLSFIHYSLIIMVLIILIHYSSQWIKTIVTGVERLVQVTAGGLIINEGLGKPIPVPNLGSGNKDNKDNKYTKGTNTDNKSGNKSSQSILFSSLIKFFKSKQENIAQRNSLILPIILNIIDINIPEGSENLTNYAFGVMILSLVALLCFINVLGYFMSFYILDKYNIETRFPKLNKIKTYYQNSTIIFILFESLFCILILLFLIISAYLYLKKVLITS